MNMAAGSAGPVGRSDDGIPWPYPPDLQPRLDLCISFGSTGIIERLPCGDKIKKSPHPMACSWDKILMRKQLQREFEVYQRLPSHPRLIRMFGFSEPDDDGERGLILEYMPNGSLKAALESDTDIPVERRVQWCVEAAEAVVHLHSYGIIHADIRPENMVLDARLGVRIIDFSGASIDGKEALSLESTRFFLIRNVRDKANAMSQQISSL
ncbi:uncharacterized protein E0L32_004931 [Thyridium curvatum]|uniref:EKC/KEOPS complex subunit BUD32 n=1 Tax=Thyridium curvatum TaxID=1093900 RepID=A0A507AXZ1_9PEZI|nr:uncharacterized protein E0L32_004931 [Thyridium curvatum]TPX14822.1 hypothetical protein E0L32_004931 [Thyridium curvatum]